MDNGQSKRRVKFSNCQTDMHVFEVDTPVEKVLKERKDPWTKTTSMPRKKHDGIECKVNKSNHPRRSKQSCKENLFTKVSGANKSITDFCERNDKPKSSAKIQVISMHGGPLGPSVYASSGAQQMRPLDNPQTMCGTTSAPCSLSSAAMEHTLRKTREKIRRVSDMDLEEAYTCLNNLRLLEKNIDQKKVSHCAALNVPADARIFTDLLEVDVPDSQLGPRINRVRKHKVRKHQDPVPDLNELFLPRSVEIMDAWPSFPFMTIPFSSVKMCDARLTTQRTQKWEKQSDKLLSDCAE